MKARPILPLDPTSSALRVRSLYKAGNVGAAIAMVEARVKEHPEDLAAWRSLARLFTETCQFDRADATISRAFSTFGEDATLLALWVFVKHELGLFAQARDVALNAAAHFPDWLSFQFDSRLLLPMVYKNSTDLVFHRKRFDAGLAELESMLPVMQQDPARIYALERTNFLLAYQGKDDLPLQRRYANILGAMIGAADADLRVLPPRAPVSPVAGPRKLRVGFVGKWFFSCTAGNYFERWITQLDPSRFERFVYYTGQTSDEVTARIGSAAEHFTRLQGDVRTNALSIRADALDILIHPEVGMSTDSYLLASCRLAPMQCVAWGHPVTTGSSAIDVFFSCAEMEPTDYRAHYSERVVLLEGIGVDYAMPALGAPGVPGDFGLPSANRLYFCPQSLFKIHPDMDIAFAKILEGDSLAVLVFFQADSRAITLAFADRLAKTLFERGINAKSQIKFLPRLDACSFRKALRVADVLLDPFHWSGGGTSLDAFAGNVPVVTLPGSFMRGRQTAAMLKMLDANMLVAADIDGYVKTAIEVATNKTFNLDVRAVIDSGKRTLFNRDDLNGQFASVLRRLAQEPPQGPVGI